MFNTVNFNPSLPRINGGFNFEKPVRANRFVANAINNGVYNANHPKTADNEYFKAIGMSVSPVANRLDIQC